MTLLTTAVVIPLFDGRDIVLRCLDALEWTRGAGVSVVVVDSGSTDGGPQVIREHFPWVAMLNVPSDLWWAGATNSGCTYAIAQLGADRLVLLNHDCTMSETTYSSLVSVASEYPDDIICSHVMLPSGQTLFAGGFRNGVSGMLTIRDYWVPESHAQSGLVTWCGGMGVVIPATLFENLRGFDELALPHYYADADFCLRARRAGARVWYCSEAIVTNDKSTSGLSVGKTVASWSLLVTTLRSRKSSVNVHDTVRFYSRHGGWRLPIALAHVYVRHIGSGVKRIVYRRFSR